MVTIRTASLLAAAAVLTVLASAASAYEATYTAISPGTAGSGPDIFIGADSHNGEYGYGMTYYYPTTDSHSGTVHITFDPLGHPGTTTTVLAWLSGDTTGLVDNSIAGYDDVTATSDPTWWNYWQHEVSNDTVIVNHTGRPFDKMWVFDVPSNPGGTVDYSWDVGPYAIEQFAFVPEPASCALLALGATLLLGRRR